MQVSATIASRQIRTRVGLIALLLCSQFVARYPVLAIAKAFDEQRLKAEQTSADIGENAADNDTPTAHLRITGIAIEGNRLITTSEVFDAFNLRVGDEFSRSEIASGLRSISALGYFDDRILKAIPQRKGDGITIKIVLCEYEPVHRFVIVGNKAIGTVEIQKLLAAEVEKPQNRIALSRDLAKIEQMYRAKGYLDARVVDMQNDSDGTITIVIKEYKKRSVGLKSRAKPSSASSAPQSRLPGFAQYNLGGFAGLAGYTMFATFSGNSISATTAIGHGFFRTADPIGSHLVRLNADGRFVAAFNYYGLIHTAPRSFTFDRGLQNEDQLRYSGGFDKEQTKDNAAN